MPMPSLLPASTSTALLALAVSGRAWAPVLGAFVAGWGAAWLLLKGFGPNTRRDALGRFKVCVHVGVGVCM